MTDSDTVHGFITHTDISNRNDFLFRVSLKAVIFNKDGHVLV